MGGSLVLSMLFIGITAELWTSIQQVRDVRKLPVFREVSEIFRGKGALRSLQRALILYRGGDSYMQLIRSVIYRPKSNVPDTAWNRALLQWDVSRMTSSQKGEYLPNYPFVASPEIERDLLNILTNSTRQEDFDLSFLSVLKPLVKSREGQAAVRVWAETNLSDGEHTNVFAAALVFLLATPEMPIAELLKENGTAFETHNSYFFCYHLENRDYFIECPSAFANSLVIGTPQVSELFSFLLDQLNVTLASRNLDSPMLDDSSGQSRTAEPGPTISAPGASEAIGSISFPPSEDVSWDEFNIAGDNLRLLGPIIARFTASPKEDERARSRKALKLLLNEIPDELATSELDPSYFDWLWPTDGDSEILTNALNELLVSTFKEMSIASPLRARFLFYALCRRSLSLCESAGQEILSQNDSELRKSVIVILVRYGSQLGIRHIDEAFSGSARRLDKFRTVSQYLYGSEATTEYIRISGHDYLKTGKLFPPAGASSGDSVAIEISEWENFINRYPYHPATDDAFYRLAAAEVIRKNFVGALNVVDRYLKVRDQLPDVDADRAFSAILRILALVDFPNPHPAEADSFVSLRLAYSSLVKFADAVKDTNVETRRFELVANLFDSVDLGQIKDSDSPYKNLLIVDDDDLQILIDMQRIALTWRVSVLERETITQETWDRFLRVLSAYSSPEG